MDHLNMASTVTTHSAISIVNAIRTGLGGAIGIDLLCRIRASISDKKKDQRGDLTVKTTNIDSHGLIQTCVNYVERYLSIKLPKNSKITIGIDSDIPVAVGLKSSSAISTGVVSAVARLLGEEEEEEIGAKDILEISCRASKDSQASITGAFDDAIACFLGGLVLTDNRHLRVLKHTEVPNDLGSIVVLRVPRTMKKYTSSIKREIYSQFKNNAMKAFDLAKSGNVLGAMMLNSLIQCSALGYSFSPVFSAISEGATCAGVSGKGPAIAAICITSKIANRIQKAWYEEEQEATAKNRKSLPHGISVLRTKVVQPRELLIA
jgi:shikimate kinase